jgi:hypothetical protein
VNRRDALRSLLTLPVAATTIQRTNAAAIQGQSHRIPRDRRLASAWDDPYGAELNIGHTDFSNGRKVYER